MHNQIQIPATGDVATTASGSETQLGADIRLRDVCVGYSSVDVLTGIDLDVQAGEFIALLGASGCGKTTLLRSLAGFVPIRQGEVLVGGANVAGMPPEKRNMAMMFQSYALWPHMTVAQNIGYGLRLRGWKRARIDARVHEMAALVGLEDFKARKVTALSGGQRQRVALARALAIDPPVLLLDEPLSNLDAGIRAMMRHEIRALQQRLGLTAILVTHDREEAMSMADRMVLLNLGRIAQTGTPEEVFHLPKSPYVAKFMGAGNQVEVNVTAGEGKVRITGEGVTDTVLPVGDGTMHSGVHCADPPEGPMVVMFHSDAVRLRVPDDSTDGELRLKGTVVQHSYLGAVYRHTLSVGSNQIMADHNTRIHVGTQTDVCVPASALSLFAREHAAAEIG